VAADNERIQTSRAFRDQNWAGARYRREVIVVEDLVDTRHHRRLDGLCNPVVALLLCGGDTLESGRKLFDRQIDEADREELSRIVDSARIPNPRRDTKTLVRKPRPVEVVVADAFFESSDQNRAKHLSSFLVRDSILGATEERRRRSPTFV
jgi:hypothetical protein